MTDLKPGREMDALVAEKVMGRQVEKAAATGELLELIGNVWMPVAKYSTDISAAWEVVEKLKDEFRSGMVIETGIGVAHLIEVQVYCYATREHGEKVISDSAPHAICLAALKAVGHE